MAALGGVAAELYSMAGVEALQSCGQGKLGPAMVSGPFGRRWALGAWGGGRAGES